MKIYYTKKAVIDLSNLSSELQKRVAVKMRFFAKQDNPLKFAKRLQNSRLGDYRFRVGDARIIFDVERNSIFVLKISMRDSVYE